MPDSGPCKCLLGVGSGLTAAMTKAQMKVSAKGMAIAKPAVRGHVESVQLGDLMLIIAMLVLLVLVAYPTTALGRTFRRLLVDLPAHRLNSVTLGQIVFYCALGLSGLILFLLLETEGVRLFTFMAPDLIVWFTVFDVSLFLDVMILGIMLSATTRVRPIVTLVVRWVRQVRSIAVARVFGHARTKARTSRPGVASDEPDPTGFAFAPA